MKLNQRNMERENFWKDKISAWEKSGLNQSEFCKQNNIDKQLFSKWKIRISKNNGNNFVQIPFKIEKDFSSLSEIELIIKEQYKIKVQSNFDPETLKKLIKTIEG